MLGINMIKQNSFCTANVKLTTTQDTAHTLQVYIRPTGIQNRRCTFQIVCLHATTLVIATSGK